MPKYKQCDTVTVNRRKYTVLKEKGDLYYLCPNSEHMGKYIYLWFPNGNHLIKTRTPASVFRLLGKKRDAFPKEIEIRDDRVFLFGKPFSIEKDRSSRESSTLCIVVNEALVFLNIQYMSLTLQSVTSA